VVESLSVAAFVIVVVGFVLVRPSSNSRRVAGVLVLTGLAAYVSLASWFIPRVIKKTYIGTAAGGPNPEWLAGFSSLQERLPTWIGPVMLCALGLAAIALVRAAPDPTLRRE
jgi:hypothetical protein